MKVEAIKLFQIIKNMKLENKLAFAALITSFIFFIITVKHNQKTVMPVLQFSTFEKEKVDGFYFYGVKVENLGLGPAEIIISNTYFSNQDGRLVPVNSMLDISSAMAHIGWFGDFEYQWSDLEAKSFLSISQRKDLFKLDFKPDNWSQGNKIFFSSCYCSIHEECFYSSSITYHKPLDYCDIEQYRIEVDLDLNVASKKINKDT